MYRETIDTREAIDRFHALMQKNSQKRLLLMKGPTHTGKSHLLGDVFPSLALEEYKARNVIIKVRKPVGIPSILDSACNDLGRECCICYRKAVSEKMRQPNAAEAIKESTIVASKVDIEVNTENDELNPQLWYLHLTEKFVNDVERLGQDNHLIVFFVDKIDGIDGQLQVWLLDTFLKQLTRLDRVRVVVAAQDMPEVHPAYAAFCEPCLLSTITDIRAYITYCRNSNIKLLEETIKVVAFLSDYYPGFFVNNIERLRRAKQV